MENGLAIRSGYTGKTNGVRLEVSFSLLDRVLEVAEALGIDVMSLSHEEYLTYRRTHMELRLPMPPLISLYSRAHRWAYIRELASAYAAEESLSGCSR